MKSSVFRQSVIVLVCAASLAFVGACAARGPRNIARVAALTAGDAAYALTQAESQTFTSLAQSTPNTYPIAAHLSVVDGELKLLRLVRGYERAVAAWPDGQPAPAAVLAAQSGLLAGLDDFEKAIPAVAAVREPLLKALAALRAVVTTTSAMRELPRPEQAEVPIGAILGIVQVIYGLLVTGRATLVQIAGDLRKRGATDEELAGVDAKLSEEITRLESAVAAAGQGATTDQ